MAPIYTHLRLTARHLFSHNPIRQHTLGIQSRTLQQTSLLCKPRKNSQDKDSIDTESTEYTKSGTDDEVARQAEAAFDPEITSPEAEKAKAGEGNKESGNPLDMSPANREVSKQMNPSKGEAEILVISKGSTAARGAKRKSDKEDLIVNLSPHREIGDDPDESRDAGTYGTVL